MNPSKLVRDLQMLVRWSGPALLSLCCVALFGCAPGFSSTRELQSAQQGPANCASRCWEMGMRMGAFVLVGSQAAGCVCEPLYAPPNPPPAPVSQGGVSGVAAGYVVIEAARQAQAQAAQAQQQQNSTHR